MSSPAGQLAGVTGFPIGSDAVENTPLARSQGRLSIAGQASIDLGLPIASGTLMAMAFMPPPLGIVAWVALVPFAAAIARAKGTFELYVGAYLGGLLFYLHGLDFIRTRVSGSGLAGSHAVDWFVNACIWAAVWPLTLYLARRFVHRVTFPMVVWLPVVWVASEFLRYELGWVINWSPFPWLQLGLTQTPYLPLIQVADLGGVWAVAGCIAAVNGALFDAISRRRWQSLGVALGIFAATWLYGEFRIWQTATEPGPSVALVPVSLRDALTIRNSPKADVLLWSETISARLLDESNAESIQGWSPLAQSTNSTLVIGCVRADADARFNSAAVVGPNKGYLGCYDKCFPVPWSEFTPWKGLGLAATSANFSHGTAHPVFPVGKFTCSPTICYDVCFGELYRDFLPRPDFFVVSSRETSDLTGYVSRMLLSMTKLRAVENRRSFVRNVEGGHSGVVDSVGRYTAAPEPPWKAPVSVGSIGVDHRDTLAHFGGDWLPLLCCASLGFGMVRTRRRG